MAIPTSVNSVRIVFFMVVLSTATFMLTPLGPAFGNTLDDSCMAVVSIPIFKLPATMELCGEPVPLSRQDVFEMLDREFVVSVYDRAQVIMWLKRAHRYFPYIEARLKEKGLPEDLKYVAVVESSLKTYTFSPAGAVGPWQFVKSTAERYGLLVNDWIDERLNFERATDGSLSYLGDLHQEFGSWALAMSGYNCGEKRISREIEQQGVRSFYDLNLPLETERYIFRILAAKLLLTSPQKYGYTIPSEILYVPLDWDYVEFSLPDEMNIRQLASVCGTTVKVIREMNPEIKKNSIPAGRYRLKVPKGMADQFKANLEECRPQKELKVSNNVSRKTTQVH